MSISRGSVASLADITAQVINRATHAPPDSTGQRMVSIREDLLIRLQCALASLYPDERDHNTNVKHALARKVTL